MSTERVRRRVRYRGGWLDDKDIGRIRQLIRRHPMWCRSDLARGVCQIFDWRRPNGEWSTRSCLELLGRMDVRGWIRLPPSRRVQNGSKRKRCVDENLCVEPRPEFLEHLGSTRRLVVRPISTNEFACWRASMQRYHYLGDILGVGESLRYVALLEDEWVALLLWSGATLHNPPRDQFVAWDTNVRAQNLVFVANNARFLILPWIRQPNLASRILAMNLRRLSRDWMTRYSHPIWMAETFVDTSRFHGGCYRASNWRDIGTTKGWSKRGASYAFHGRTKTVFVYPLDRNACIRLRTPPNERTQRTMKEQRNAVAFDFTKLESQKFDELLEILSSMTDRRKRRGLRYSIRSILAIGICATLTGATSFVAIAEWAIDQTRETLKRLGSKYGVAPNERTFRRVFQSVNIQEIDDKLGQWVTKVSGLCPGQGVAIDGKTLRGSADGDRKPVHLLSAVVHGTGVVIAQMSVSEKTNEIPCAKPLLQKLPLEGCIITADALHTQKETARFITEDLKADYVLIAKGNQPTLQKDIEALHAEDFSPGSGNGGQNPWPH